MVKIYNGYESAQLLNTADGNSNFSIGMMGRGDALKGWETLITSFKQLPEDADLYLAGESDYLNDLKKGYKEDQRIHFLGYCNDIEAFYNKLDVFVLPTLFPYESLPNVIIESLFYGVPVIATDVGEIANMLKDDDGKRAGFLLDKVDGKINIDQLKDQLLYLYNNPNVLTEMKDLAKKAFEKFNMETCVADYISLYNRILNN